MRGLGISTHTHRIFSSDPAQKTAFFLSLSSLHITLPSFLTTKYGTSASCSCGLLAQKCMSTLSWLCGRRKTSTSSKPVEPLYQILKTDWSSTCRLIKRKQQKQSHHVRRDDPEKDSNTSHVRLKSSKTYVFDTWARSGEIVYINLLSSLPASSLSTYLYSACPKRLC